MSHAGTGPAAGEPSAEEIRNLQEAVANTERTPQLEKGLDALLEQSEKELDRGRYQEARDAVVRVMPMRPDDARTAAAMGGAMRGLGRVQMAERTLSRALQLDPKQPRALYEMGRLLAQHKEIDKLNKSLGAKFHVFKGIESDILGDGSLDYPDDILARFDLVATSYGSLARLPDGKTRTGLPERMLKRRR